MAGPVKLPVDTGPPPDIDFAPDQSPEALQEQELAALQAVVLQLKLEEALLAILVGLAVKVTVGAGAVMVRVKVGELLPGDGTLVDVPLTTKPV